MHKPAWFKPGLVAVSTAATCGINKDGEDLFLVDPETGRRTDEIDDSLRRDAAALLANEDTATLHWVDADEIRNTSVAVPTYYDDRPLELYKETRAERWPNFGDATLGELMDSGELVIHGGHGSPSADLRTGEIPYIKVSDLRAGQVNINPTNRVSQVVAEQFWKSSSSGLQAFDLITPARTSKNIGDFAVLMPGQEQIVLTKEVLVVRPGEAANFDAFYLLWAMSLKIVREQWRRIVFMQTNREDTGKRFREIVIPSAPSAEAATEVSEAFRDYYSKISELRDSFRHYLQSTPDHHVYLGTASVPEAGAAD